MAIKTVHGSIEIIFEKVAQANSISLYSVYEFVDVSIPSSTKANLNMSTTYGEIFTDLDIETARKKETATSQENSNIKYVGNDEVENENNHKRNHNSCQSTNNDITGIINGGGVDLVLNSTYSDVYLRKK